MNEPEDPDTPKTPTATEPIAPKRARGRPKGSTNKNPKHVSELKHPKLGFRNRQLAALRRGAELGIVLEEAPKHIKPQETLIETVQRLKAEEEAKLSKQAKADWAYKYKNLPHLYGFKWYTWAWDFFQSTNRMNLLCAGNQLSKSSTQIRKCLDWATDRLKWEILWPNRTPRTFWYLYPTRDVATTEFKEKWLPEFMPRDKYKDDMFYGWEVEYEKKKIMAIHFKSGITLHFKTYAQGEGVLQTATVDAIFCDEEIPEHIFSELSARLFASDGYFHMVFTATLGQDMWRRAIEGRGEQELFPDAFKRQVSLHDCQHYRDGSPSPWTLDRIRRVESSCKDYAEVDRRVNGRFIVEMGRKYPAFDGTRHYVKPFPIPMNWRCYAAIDLGSGGGAHPAAITFVAVNPEGTQGWVFDGWRGDGQHTTSGDILEQFQKMRGPRRFTLQTYDWAAKDFGIIAGRNNEPFTKAVKDTKVGEDVINTLFGNNMLHIFDTSELRKLGSELTSLLDLTDKKKAKDDFIDSLRYAVVSIPWDWTAIKTKGVKDAEKDDGSAALAPASERAPTAEEEKEREIRERRGEGEEAPKEGWSELDEEFGEWNEAYGS